MKVAGEEGNPEEGLLSQWVAKACQPAVSVVI